MTASPPVTSRPSTPQHPSSALSALSRMLTSRFLIVSVAIGWAASTAFLLFSESTDGTRTLAFSLMGMVILGSLQSHRQLHGLHQRMARNNKHVALTERRLKGAERRLDEIAARLARSRSESASANLVQSLTKTITQSAEGLRRSTKRDITTAYHELEALHNLYAMIPAERRVPPMRGWAASPDLLLLLIEMLRAERPRLMVECGSGTSTLWSALAIRRFNLDTRVVALEHDAQYARETTNLLMAHGVADLAEVRLAPLEPVDLDGGTWQWYARSGWSDLQGIGLLFVDGPPGKTGPHARFPALPLLGDRLAPGAAVVLDDLIRTDEQEIVQRWLEGTPALEEQRHPLEKGASVLRRGPSVEGPRVDALQVTRPLRDGDVRPTLIRG